GTVIQTQGGVTIGTVSSVTSNTQLTLIANAPSTQSGATWRTATPGPSDAVALGTTNGTNPTVTIDIANEACASLILGRNNGTASSTGTIAFATTGSPSLTVSGAVAVGGTNSGGGSTGTITFQSGSTLTAGSLQLGNSGGAGVINMTLGGTLNVSGAVTVVTNAANNWTF